MHFVSPYFTLREALEQFHSKSVEINPGRMVPIVKGIPNLPAIFRLPLENEKTLQASLELFTLLRPEGLLLSSKTY